MKLFIAVRWGNADSPDGPDGEDTHYLVRARNHTEAGQLADHELQLLSITSSRSRKPVMGFCQRIIEIGSCGRTKGVSQVMMGPWIAYPSSVHHEYYPTWEREKENDPWQRVQHET